MATYLQTDGDINQAKRKRAGEVPGIGDLVQSAYDPNPSIRNAQASQDAAEQRNAVNGWPAPTGPNPARAQQMQEQSRIPVVRGTGVEDAYSSNPLLRRMQETADTSNQRYYTQRADRSDALRETVDRETGRALATAYDKGAAYNKAVSLTAPMADQYEQLKRDGLVGNPVEKSPTNGGASVPSRAWHLVKGIGGMTAGVLSAPLTSLADLSREGLAQMTDSELTNPSAQRDKSGRLMYDAVGNFDRAFDGTADAVRNMIGATPVKREAASTAQPTTGTTTKPAAGTEPAQPGTQQTPGQPATQAASGYTQTGIDGVVMRRGEGGVPEFTNDEAAVAGASAMPRGGIGNIGNGIGMATFGNDGDSRLALERFERANQIRAQSIAENRGRELGDNGGRLTVVRDSSRSPTLAELQNARLEANLADVEARRAGVQEAAATGADTRATNSLTRAKTQQDIASGALDLQNAQTVQQLRALIADPSLTDAERQAAMQAYGALTISPKDRYMTVEGGTNEFGGRDASRVFDRLTGQGIGSPSATLPRTSVPYSEIEATAKATGMSAKKIEAELVAKGVKIER